jgi:5-methyltetrahydropteroyltriglutamate--homocysteine methyltransferase
VLAQVHFRGGRASIDIKAYPELDIFFEDLAAAYRKEIDLLYKAGCRFIQLDDTNLVCVFFELFGMKDRS